MSMIGNYVRVSATRLAELRANPESITTFLYPKDKSRVESRLNIDKAWHAIHFLLTGQTWEGDPPLVNAVLGGKPIGDVDVGYGPARALEPEEVRDLAEALSDISSTELMDRFEPGVLNDNNIYPQGWSGEGHDREYVESNYRQLVKFMGGAAEAGDAVIEYLN